MLLAIALKVKCLGTTSPYGQTPFVWNPT